MSHSLGEMCLCFEISLEEEQQKPRLEQSWLVSKGWKIPFSISSCPHILLEELEQVTQCCLSFETEYLYVA